MNPVVMLCYNTTPEQLQLTKKAYAAVLAQDVGDLYICIVNNGSTQETVEWLDSLPTRGPDYVLHVTHHKENQAPTVVANRGVAEVFAVYNFLLGVPNDVLLPPNAYRLMLQWPRGFVCATPIEDDRTSEVIASPEPCHGVCENTPMSIMLTRKWAYDAIVAKDGYFFDEGYFHYCSDCDLALRMAACGIRGVQLDIPVWHYRSASWRLAKSGIGTAILDQAGKDNTYFQKKWGFSVSDPKYRQSAADIDFKG